MVRSCLGTRARGTSWRVVAVAITLLFSFAACKKKEEAKTEPATTEPAKATEPTGSATAPPPTAGSAAAPGSAAPAATGTAPSEDAPEECKKLHALIERLSKCDKVPRTGLTEGWEIIAKAHLNGYASRSRTWSRTPA